MKKKMILLGGLAAAVMIVLAGLQFLKPESNDQLKSIQITIIDKHEPETVLFEDTLKTKEESLGNLLRNQKAFSVQIEESTYGAYITSMADKASDNEYFWVYESDNNQSCKEMGMCPAADECMLNDSDRFIFELTNTFE